MRGATCNFCGKSFRNRQAVRAHLKGCQGYRHLPKATVPTVRSRLATSGTRDERPAARPTLASGPGQSRAQHFPSRLATTPPLNTTGLGRSTIQSVKKQVIHSWWSLNHVVPSETKAEALVAIEQELSRLPLDQFPRSELVAIAEGIRDGIYRPIIQAQQRAREEEEGRRNQARLRTMLLATGAAHAIRTLRQQRDLDASTRLDLEQKVKRALAQEVDGRESEADVQARVDELLKQNLEPICRSRRALARQHLIDHGVAYAKQALAGEEHLDRWQLRAVQADVKQDLHEQTTGEESEADVETFVDEILYEVLEGNEDEDDEEED